MGWGDNGDVQQLEADYDYLVVTYRDRLPSLRSQIDNLANRPIEG